jgi:hypothetical protein
MKGIIHLVVAVVMSTMVYGQEIIERVPPAQTDYETMYGPFEDEICKLCLEDGDYNILDFLAKDSNNISWGMSYSLGKDFISSNELLNNGYDSKTLKSLSIFFGIVNYIDIFYSSNTLSFQSPVNDYGYDKNYSIYGIRVSPYQTDELKTYIGYGFGTLDYNTNTSEFQIGALYNLHKLRDRVNIGLSLSANFTQFIHTGNVIGSPMKSDNNISLGVFFKF